MDRIVLSALSLANYLPTVLCGIVLSLSAGVGGAEESADNGGIDTKSFRCITEMTHVRQFYVDNLLGNLDATLGVANRRWAVRIHRAPSYSWFRVRPWRDLVLRDDFLVDNYLSDDQRHPLSKLGTNAQRAMAGGNISARNAAWAA